MIRAGWDSNRLLSNLSEAAVEPILPRLADVPLVRGGVLREGVYFPFSGLIAEFVLIKDRQSYTGIMGKDGALHLEYLRCPPLPGSGLGTCAGQGSLDFDIRFSRCLGSQWLGSRGATGLLPIPVNLRAAKCCL